ncbi:dTDP-6-deoxy-L-talose 4-dehydrogenase (NAD+) [Paraburkholderia sp. HC6.4b]|uniref:NAD-dependent epimerase/dehydratase family protein n=1 Tax=unclassified Paraburkholderia TaxID=2615204 RepID=UPI001613AA23|nr:MULTISPECIES: NAD(P)-dependent oxidoreductase [unclassified Paraburkholderia]MBB5408226.1 dTDP-6-deoxy-L-talose 4-dehydrogenase (NAD+) [Paraburkholderia sp. HC6.4b]MBB5453217.1 dTDP-6-deoxy-L-talose 4-dehydrogenase (NAD+) [Paraburkholderia sp. Kb1A]
MKIIVTGATGFVGRHLVPELLSRGHQIVAVVREISKAHSFQWSSEVRIVACDIGCLGPNFFDLLGNQDAVIHLAWPGLPNYQALFHFEENLLAAYQFLKQCVMAGVSQVLVTGTCFEYGMRDGLLSEALESQPANAYSLAKDTLRKFLENWRQQQSFTLQWARLFYMYGEGQNPHSVLAQLDRAIDDGDAVFNMSGGEQLRDYLPVAQVAQRLALLIEHPELSGITNICSGVPISVRRLVERRIAERNARIALNLGHYPYPSHEPMAFWGDPHRLQLVAAGL